VATVIDGDFEWDDAKARSNLEKHGVSFPEAATVFADPSAVYLDDGSGADRMVVVGTSLRDRILYVVHVERGRRDRINQRTSRNAGRTRRLRVRRTTMTQSAKRRTQPETEPVRVLGRGLHAARGVHLTLRTLREALGKTQVDLAKQSQIDQADVSRLEARSDFEDCQVATLRRYIEALGGSLELVAQFGDRRIAIAGVHSQRAIKPANKPLQRAVRKPTRR
jgi:uncharacterized DUF497 family protein